MQQYGKSQNGYESRKFFISWLAQANQQDIVDKTKKFEEENAALQKNMIDMIWHMRGGISITEIYELPLGMFKHINEFIKERYEMSKKAGTPIL